jgi:hypothetical protein
MVSIWLTPVKIGVRKWNMKKTASQNEAGFFQMPLFGVGSIGDIAECG